MTAAALLSIGEVARSTGLAVSAVRYYDELGVISAAARVGGKRRFEEDAVGRLNFIRRSQEAGFSLNEIRALLDDQHGGWRALVDDKLAELQERRDRLDAMIRMLTEFKECGCTVVAECARLSEC